MSTAMTRPPKAAAICAADTPMPPAPITTTHSPGCMRPTCATALYAVPHRQDRPAALRASMPSGRRTQFRSALLTATSSPYPPLWL